MKVKELMLGDWVKMKFHLDDTYSTKQVDFISAAIDGWLDYEPIPLTPEILEKNGFERNEPYWWIEDHLLEIYRNEWDGVLCVAGVRGLELNYVHQIQQILRICGLNDLADNFKV